MIKNFHKLLKSNRLIKYIIILLILYIIFFILELYILPKRENWKEIIHSRIDPYNHNIGQNYDHPNYQIINNSNINITESMSRQSIIFLHFHKAAGSSLCMTVRKNHMYLLFQQLRRNCNLWGDGPNDLDITYRDGGFENCHARAKYARKWGVQFMGIERYFDFDFCHLDFLYLTIFRKPINRLISNALYEEWDKKDVMSWTKKTKIYYGEPIMEGGTPVINNFYIRSLCGLEVYLLGLNEITREHLEIAKQKLREFDIILILEDIKRSHVQLRYFLRWHKLNQNINTIGKRKKSYEFDNEEIEIFKKLNQLDIELYEYAIKLSKGIDNFATERLIEENYYIENKNIKKDREYNNDNNNNLRTLQTKFKPQ